MRSSAQLSAVMLAALLHMSGNAVADTKLATIVVQANGQANAASYDGVVEAIRQTVISSQVSGAVVDLAVKTGDTVKEGQLLARIDARSAAQAAVASQAETAAARTALDLASKDYQRQRHLFEKNYISQSAMERAEAQFHATSAQLSAQIAQASIAHIQSDFYVIKAPYAGIVSDVPIALGDMALPGKPLVTLYDPSSLRVTASIPQASIGSYAPNQSFNLEFPNLSNGHQWLARTELQILPTVDAGTHSTQVRIDLPHTLKEVTPGMFARVWLPIPKNVVGMSGQLSIPASAVVRRAEMTGVYVIDANNKPLLRQVRLGKAQRDTIEILSGISAGDRIATDAQAAAKEAR